MPRALTNSIIKAETHVRHGSGLGRCFPSFQARGSVSAAAFSEATLPEDWRRQCAAAAIGAGSTS
jgi:hypothetical protein